MAPQGVEPPWQFSQAFRQYYYYVPSRDEIVLQDRTRRPRPQQIPASTFQAAAWEEPPGLEANYMTQPGNPGTSGSQREPRSQPGGRSQPLTAIRMADPSVNALAGSLQQMRVSGRRPNSFDVTNPSTHVRTVVNSASPITDPDFLRRGVRSESYVVSTGTGDSDSLFPTYKLRAANFFRPGRVFMILWSEPAGGTAQSQVTDQQTSVTRHGERVYSKVRKFVVIRQAEQYCSALPVATYNGRGVSKEGVLKSEHVIIFTGRTAPPPTRNERPRIGEEGMREQPIRVDPDMPYDALDPMSRLDLGKVHTIHTNIKVKCFGMINQGSLQPLADQFASVWSHQPRAQDSPAAGPSRTSLITTRPQMSDAMLGSVNALQQQLGITRQQALDRIERSLSTLVIRQIAESAESSASRSQAHAGSAQSRDEGEGEGDDGDEEEEEEEEEDDEDEDDDDEGDEDEEDDDDDDGGNNEARQRMLAQRPGS